MLILPLGYTVQEVFAAGGNPYGTSFVSEHIVTGPDDQALTLARYQGRRLASYAAVIAEARRQGRFDVKRPVPASFAAVPRG
jgi:NAD(P)H dehydrogenase (quinone)